jgi:DNA repair exonuclease SbcCD ATPase subunit
MRKLDISHQRRLRPEEEELIKKRGELAEVQAVLGERELELADVRKQLAGFESRYLRQVGTLYAELDEWNAGLCELRAKSSATEAAKQAASRAREQAQHTYNQAHGEASQTFETPPSAELRAVFREIAKRIHPDLAKDGSDRELRTRLMADANRAYAKGDFETLQRIMRQYEHSAVPGEGVGAQLVRVIRQISQARRRVEDIEDELARLGESSTARLRQDCDSAAAEGRDLLHELAADVSNKIEAVKNEYATLLTMVKT